MDGSGYVDLFCALPNRHAERQRWVMNSPDTFSPARPNGEQVSGRWHLMSYDFQMKPGAELVPQPMMSAAE
jgi:hypothetical protein